MSGTTAELGDFQTPLDLASTALATLRRVQGTVTRVFEPTCGTGSFLRAAADQYGAPLEMLGIEIQEPHVAVATRKLAEHAAKDIDWQVRLGDIFSHDLRSLAWRTPGRLLVVGNPPWITLSKLGAMQSRRVPARANIRRVRGIDALTGESNFDVAEYIWMRLLTELGEESPTVALLCKTSVARRVLTLAHRLQLHVAEARLWRIDAQRTFGVAADAGLFMMRLDGLSRNYCCPMYESLASQSPFATMGLVDGDLVADVAAHQASRRFEGRCPLEWRQGVKHDAGKVLELARDAAGVWRNGLGEAVDVEADWSFPLMKGSDVHADRAPTRRVLITQRSLGDDPRGLQRLAPKLWAYLEAHEERFAARKSSIYRNRPRFSMFGIGPYSFSQWKVAISGLSKEPRFRVIPPREGRPVLLDDTSYFVPVESSRQAAVVAAILGSEPARKLLSAIVFVDAKRVITKKLLQRIDLREVLVAARERISSDARRLHSTIGKEDATDDLESEVDALLRQWQPREIDLPLYGSESDGKRLDAEA